MKIIRAFVGGVVFALAIFGLNAAVAGATSESDSQLTKALIGNWGMKFHHNTYPISRAFISFKPNGTFQYIAILDFAGCHGREERNGEWHVQDGRLIRETHFSVAPQFGYVPSEQSVTVHGSAIVLQGKQREDKQELQRTVIPAPLPPFLPHNAMDKLIIEKIVPRYPVEARQARLQGAGFFNLRINGKTGIVESVIIARSTGHRMLDDAAVGALKRWRFKTNVERARVPIQFTMTK
jgi:TonB family protein